MRFSSALGKYCAIGVRRNIGHALFVLSDCLHLRVGLFRHKGLEVF